MDAEKTSAYTNGNGWRLGKEIPLALMVALMVQTGGFIWWMSSLNSTVSATALSLGKVELRIAAIDVQLTAFSATVTTPIALNAQKIVVMEGEVHELRLRVDALRFEQVRGLQQIDELRSKK